VNSDRRRSIILGILLISGILFGILNSVPALENPDYLTKLSAIKTQVLIAVFFQSAMAAVYVCIAVLLYPIIKLKNIVKVLQSDISDLGLLELHFFLLE
jgi:hypothetical protein